MIKYIGPLDAYYSFLGYEFIHGSKRVANTMKSKVIFDHPSGQIIACDDNPTYYVQAPANSLAITRTGDVYRKYSSGGAGDWVLLCTGGGVRIGDYLDAEPVLEQPRRSPQSSKGKNEAT